MPELKIYRENQPLPAEYECQIRAFIRMTWYDGYAHDVDEPLVPAERHPQHLVVAERHAVISHARVIWVDVHHAGETFRMYCLGDVLTYPAFRNKGYGRMVVDTGTELIKGDAEADTAILFTDPSLEGFYKQSGWEHIPGFRSTMGSAEHPEDHEGFAMMLFLSDKGRAARTAFETQTVFLPGYGW